MGEKNGVFYLGEIFSWNDRNGERETNKMVAWPLSTLLYIHKKKVTVYVDPSLHVLDSNSHIETNLTRVLNKNRVNFLKVIKVIVILWFGHSILKSYNMVVELFETFYLIH